MTRAALGALVAVQARFEAPADLGDWFASQDRGPVVYVLPQHPCDLRPTDRQLAIEVAVRAPTTMATVGTAMRRLGSWCAFGSAILENGAPVAVHVLVDPAGARTVSARRTVDLNTSWSPVDGVDLIADTPVGRVMVLGGADLCEPETLTRISRSGVSVALVTAAIDTPQVRDDVPLMFTAVWAGIVAVANRVDGCDAPGRSCIAADGAFVAGPAERHAANLETVEVRHPSGAPRLVG